MEDQQLHNYSSVFIIASFLPHRFSSCCSRRPRFAWSAFCLQFSVQIDTRCTFGQLTISKFLPAAAWMEVGVVSAPWTEFSTNNYTIVTQPNRTYVQVVDGWFSFLTRSGNWNGNSTYLLRRGEGMLGVRQRNGSKGELAAVGLRNSIERLGGCRQTRRDGNSGGEGQPK